MATTLPLNKFRLLTKTLDSGSNLIYKENIDISTIILSSQITNITGSNQTVSVSLQKSGSNSMVAILNNGIIPPDESFNPFAGKVVLEKYDGLYMSTPVSGALQVVLSVLENATS